jgi:hypothetical protein
VRVAWVLRTAFVCVAQTQSETPSPWKMSEMKAVLAEVDEGDGSTGGGENGVEGEEAEHGNTVEHTYDDEEEAEEEAEEDGDQSTLEEWVRYVVSNALWLCTRGAEGRVELLMGTLAYMDESGGQYGWLAELETRFASVAQRCNCILLHCFTFSSLPRWLSSFACALPVLHATFPSCARFLVCVSHVMCVSHVVCVCRTNCRVMLYACLKLFPFIVYCKSKIRFVLFLRNSELAGFWVFSPC